MVAPHVPPAAYPSSVASRHTGERRGHGWETFQGNTIRQAAEDEQTAAEAASQPLRTEAKEGMSMPRDADLELRWLEEQGITVGPATEAAYRSVIAVENAACPDAVSTHAVKRAAKQKPNPVHR